MNLKIKTALKIIHFEWAEDHRYSKNRRRQLIVIPKSMMLFIAID